RPLASAAEGEGIRWVDRVDIRGEIRPALLMPPPAKRTWRIVAPRGARLLAWIALEPQVWMQNLGGVRFRVTVSSAGAGSRTRAWHVDPGRYRAHRAWVPVSFPLRAAAGTAVELTLSTEVPEGAAPAYSWALWGQPTIAERRPLRTAIGRQIQIVRSTGWRAAAPPVGGVLRGTSGSVVLYGARFRDQAQSAREPRGVPPD